MIQFKYKKMYWNVYEKKCISEMIKSKRPNPPIFSVVRLQRKFELPIYIIYTSFYYCSNKVRLGRVIVLRRISDYGYITKPL